MLDNTPELRTFGMRVRGALLLRVLTASALVMGIAILIGYVTASRELAALGGPKPAAAMTGFGLLALSLGLIALLSGWRGRCLATRSLAAVALLVNVADLIADGLANDSLQWQEWGMRGSVLLHAYPATCAVMALLSIALLLLTTRALLSAHVLSSLVLLFMSVVVIAYVLGLPVFLNPARRLAPVPAAAAGLVLIALGQVIAGRQGWIRPLLSQTSAGSMSRVLAPAVVLVPLLSVILCELAVEQDRLSQRLGWTLIVAVNATLGIVIVLGAAMRLYRGEIARARLAAIVDSCSDAIISQSPGGMIQSWNHGAEELCGYTAAEMIGCSMDRLFPPDHAHDLDESIAALRAGKRVASLETTWLTWLGERRSVLLTLSPLIDDPGVMTGVSIVARDMTPRAMAANAIEDARHKVRRSGERLKAIVDNLSESIATIDTSYRFIAFNDAYAEQFFEYSGMRITPGLNVIDCLRHLPREQNLAVAAWGRALAGEEFDTVEELGDEQDPRVVEIRYSTLRTPDGILLGATRVARDVTERVNAQHQLARSTHEVERLATVIDQASESIIITDARGLIEYVNPAFERVSGYSSAEVIGRTPALLKSGRQDDGFYRELWQTISAGNSWSGHFTNKRKDGSLYEEEATISPVRNEDGVITHFAAIKRDVTIEIALEDQLRHAQKIEAIGTLAGGVAHDFNNMLQAMLTLVQIITRKHVVSDGGKDHLRQLEKTIQRGAQLTKQLLLFARREKSNLRDIDLTAMMQELSTFLRRVVRENVQLTIETPSLPVVVKGDRGQLEQVIMNLTVNAIDAMPEGGQLTLTLRRNHERAALVIQDTGVGISDAIRDRIFEPFFTTKEAGHGTGLGLSVVHGIITTHGGTIDVEAPPGGGTRFRIALPLQHGASEVECNETLVVVDGRGERVLLVEDEPSVRDGLSMMLSMLGYHVTVATDARDALERAERESFRILVTDYMLPDRPGLEVVRALRERQPEIKAILMSGYAAPGSIDDAIAAKEVRFLQKPFSSDDLARALG